MLTGPDRHAYTAKGYVRVRGLLQEDDLAALRSAWRRLWDDIRADHPSVQWRGHQQAGRTADRIDGAYLLSPALRAFCADERLTELAANLLGAPVVLFKDKLISKGPGTFGYDLHQDWPYWSSYGVPAYDMVSLMVALDPCDEVNGALEIWPAAPDVLPAPEDDALDVDPAAVDMSAGELASLDAGDILLLHPLAPHRSSPNRANTLRRAYFVTYASAEYASAAARLEAERLEMMAPA